MGLPGFAQDDDVHRSRILDHCECHEVCHELTLARRQ
jgi:hypothetical protein